VAQRATATCRSRTLGRQSFSITQALGKRDDQEFAQTILFEVEIAGRSYSGTYTIDGNVVNVHWNGWSEKSQAGGAGAEITAKMLLRGLVRNHPCAS
jgi:hypothetical protein